MTVQCKAAVALDLHAVFSTAHKTVEISGDCEEVRQKLAELVAMESALLEKEVVQSARRIGERMHKGLTASLSSFKRMTWLGKRIIRRGLRGLWRAP